MAKKLNNNSNSKTKKTGVRGSNDFDYYNSEHGLAVIIQSKRDGLSNEEIAEKIGISRTTLYRWRDKSVTIRDALKVSRDQANANLENKAFEMAMSGNTTMMIFLLKNRMANKYKDRQEIGVDVAKEEVKESIEDLIKAFED